MLNISHITATRLLFQKGSVSHNQEKRELKQVAARSSSCGVSLMFSLPIQWEVAEILKNQSPFKAGRLSQYLPEWRKLTSDPTILQYV